MSVFLQSSVSLTLHVLVCLQPCLLVCDLLSDCGSSNFWIFWVCASELWVIRSLPSLFLELNRVHLGQLGWVSNILHCIRLHYAQYTYLVCNDSLAIFLLCYNLKIRPLILGMHSFSISLLLARWNNIQLLFGHFISDLISSTSVHYAP